MIIDSCNICKENAICDLMTVFNATKRQSVCNIMVQGVRGKGKSHTVSGNFTCKPPKGNYHTVSGNITCTGGKS